MKLLSDTHTFIWWDSEPKKLASVALKLCQDTENSIFLSVASVWEMQIKLRLGKIKLKLPLATLIEKQHQYSTYKFKTCLSFGSLTYLP